MDPPILQLTVTIAIGFFYRLFVLFFGIHYSAPEGTEPYVALFYGLLKSG